MQSKSYLHYNEMNSTKRLYITRNAQNNSKIVYLTLTCDSLISLKL